jgi:hypothetical protein
VTTSPEFQGLTQQQIDERIDLGLALAMHHAKPGVPLTYREIAAWCGCSWQKIWVIEHKALQKLRKKLSMRRDPLLIELVEQFFDRRQAVERKEFDL